MLLEVSKDSPWRGSLRLGGGPGDSDGVGNLLCSDHGDASVGVNICRHFTLCSQWYLSLKSKLKIFLPNLQPFRGVPSVGRQEFGPSPQYLPLCLCRTTQEAEKVSRNYFLRLPETRTRTGLTFIIGHKSSRGTGNEQWLMSFEYCSKCLTWVNSFNPLKTEETFCLIFQIRQGGWGPASWSCSWEMAELGSQPKEPASAAYVNHSTL